MGKYSKAVSEMNSQFKGGRRCPLEKYSKAVSEMYSQFKGEPHPLEKYIGRLAVCYGKKAEVVGYIDNELAGEPLLIVDCPWSKGWTDLEPNDVIFKECERYWYVSINDLIE
ncbi:hypothetical protein BU241P1_00012 [Bacteroides phage BU241P1]|nr:hypothetical protein BU241P1_00012 [Bacteroides phage BU241P1]